jgi:16S rRNA (uracil1498-N3)-methyltransferase
VRLFISATQIQENTILLEKEDYNHLAKSLRIKTGEIINIIADEKFCLTVEFQTFISQSMIVKVIQKVDLEVSPFEITLIQSLPKQDKMMEIIDACTQLGVRNFYPVETERSIVKWNSDKQEKHVQRWQTCIKQAAVQSKQERIPVVHPIQRFQDFVDAFIYKDYDCCVVAWEEASLKNNLKNYLRQFEASIKKVCVFVGPEGGISRKEIQSLEEKGFQVVSLGKHILRVEVAGITMVSQVNYELFKN